MDLITEQRLARRAHILATARELLAEKGYDAVTVRELAARCRVSVPTLYNQFGGKDQVLATAIEEHFAETLISGENTAPGTEAGYVHLTDLIDRWAAELLASTTYHQRLLEAFASLESTQDVQYRITHKMTLAVADDLRALKQKRQLAPWANELLVASQMTSACIASAVIWSSGHVNDAFLPASMRHATGLLLLGIARGQLARTVEDDVQTQQKALLASAPDALNALNPTPHEGGAHG